MKPNWPVVERIGRRVRLRNGARLSRRLSKRRQVELLWMLGCLRLDDQAASVTLHFKSSKVAEAFFADEFEVGGKRVPMSLVHAPKGTRWYSSALTQALRPGRGRR